MGTERPFLTARFGRNYYRGEGWILVLIFAPFPPEEQEPGAMCAALLNLRIDLFPRWPFLRIDAYCADRGGPRP